MKSDEASFVESSIKHKQGVIIWVESRDIEISGWNLMLREKKVIESRSGIIAVNRRGFNLSSWKL